MQLKPIHVRKVKLGEEPDLWHLFYNTVHKINRKDYSMEQIVAWAPDSIEENQWVKRIQNNSTFITELKNQILGFAILQKNNFIDCFFVHHLWQGKGVGTLLLNKLISEARIRGAKNLTTHASITARPFFEARGFSIIQKQIVQLRNIEFTSFVMAKAL
jgi:GNAT superfamily N-acetyltransferase